MALWHYVTTTTIHTLIYTRARVHTRARARAHACMHACMRACTHTRTHAPHTPHYVTPRPIAPHLTTMHRITYIKDILFIVMLIIFHLIYICNNRISDNLMWRLIGRCHPNNFVIIFKIAM